jgi:WhiB family redox-sensing transcriptional regulator
MVGVNMELLYDLEYEVWRDAAACAKASDVDFFAPPENLAESNRARALCASCPVRDECLAFAIDSNQTEGIWGGMTPQERSKLRRRWMRDLREAS